MALTICPFCGETTGHGYLKCRNCGKTREPNHETDPQFIAAILQPEWPNPSADFAGTIQPETILPPVVLSKTKAWVLAVLILVGGLAIGLVAPKVFQFLQEIERIFF